MNKSIDVLKSRLSEKESKKLEKINNPKLYEFIEKYIELCNPEKIFVCDDSSGDISYIRETSINNKEESSLAIKGHTVHFDSYFDQGRDKEHTLILLPKGIKLDGDIATKDREEGLAEMQNIFRDIMKGKEMFICFFCLGPANSEFSIPCVQITDSAYVAHCESLLYRKGYQEFIRQGEKAEFFKFIHSQGEVDERKVCKNISQRRIYIDREGNTVFSANTQYGGNTIGLKKLAMRLAIYKGSKEGWLTEHMLLMGVHGPGGRVTYITGAFPSLCGKTSTAMLEGETIVGDDIVYIRKKEDSMFAVNVEKGMFGIIQGINSKDDPIQWKALNNPAEIIFSNILVTDDGKVHWIGKDGEVPKKGQNHSGEWFTGKKDAKDKEIKCSHPNARFTLSLDILENLDSKLNDPKGALISAIVYGGRDSDTSVPVEESFDWVHGIITKGASLESETTAATLGKEGVREFNPMSNLDFLSVPIGEYIKSNLDFGKNIKNPPKIFFVNYFLKNSKGGFLNEKNDKKVWYKWIELRANKDADAIRTPTGFIPKYEDLKSLFKKVINKEYTYDSYKEQFTVRINENLAKIERVVEIYKTKVVNTPKILFEVLQEQKNRLNEAKSKYGEYIFPDKLI